MKVISAAVIKRQAIAANGITKRPLGAGPDSAEISGYRRIPATPTRSSDDYVEQAGRAGREVAQKLILETREELARLKIR